MPRIVRPRVVAMFVVLRPKMPRIVAHVATHVATLRYVWILNVSICPPRRPYAVWVKHGVTGNVCRLCAIRNTVVLATIRVVRDSYVNTEVARSIAVARRDAAMRALIF